MFYIVIIICKLIAFIGSFFGRGTSLPGKIAVTIYPDFLSKLTLPENIIAVTGSNGKTSTAEMITAIMNKGEGKVISNKEGSNQTEGIATLLLKNCSLTGKVNCRTIILESDERYAVKTFKSIKPSHFVITNLYRDQMTRNAHPYFVCSCLEDAIKLIPDATLIINADDPIISKLGEKRNNTLFFGMDKNEISTPRSTSIYNDCYYCPICKNELSYDYFHYAHLGSYYCNSCGFSRHSTDFTVEYVNLDQKEIIINNEKISLAFPSRYNIYNICAAFAVAAAVGLSSETAAKTLSDFVIKNGRIVNFEAGENKGILLTSKHENSVSYNLNLEYIAQQKESSTLVIVIDEISRKYFTSETSWLWDISFDILNGSAVKKIILTGNYCYDIAFRFEFIDLGNIEIVIEQNLDKAIELMKAKDAGKIFVLTCFSDKDKLYSRVKVKSPTAK
ncbi:MAG: DUF1727 domain-containing protein [Clostridia bacterium]|nr:DUF1727 domain-containing protein [Clostridia bacterium]